MLEVLSPSNRLHSNVPDSDAQCIVLKNLVDTVGWNITVECTYPQITICKIIK